MSQYKLRSLSSEWIKMFQKMNLDKIRFIEELDTHVLSGQWTVVLGWCG